MRVIRKIWFFSLLVVATLFTQNANALPAGDKELYKSLPDVIFSIGSGSAEIDCKVYKYTSGVYTDKYVYTYQISNIDSGIGLSFFSVGVLDGADAFDPDYELLLGVINPELWTVVGSPVQSVEGLFVSTIDNGESSALLWFVSDYASTSGSGALFGTLSGMPHYAKGDLLTPIPEPATLVLLGMVGLLALARRRCSV